MYRGYNLTLQRLDFDTEIYEQLLATGKRRNRIISNTVRNNLRNYLRPDGTIDGALLSSDWFPKINAHLFLSHSHADEELAIALSQWLYDTFGIVSFIDSCVWGYCDNLLKILDEEYADLGDSYSYKTRNRTTGFVHTLLCTALSKMIDKCECLFFLNTPNSLLPDPNRQETSSPWIYYELFQSSIIRTHRLRTRSFSQKRINEGLEDFRVALPATISHLFPLNPASLNAWKNLVPHTPYTPYRALDILYTHT